MSDPCKWTFENFGTKSLKTTGNAEHPKMLFGCGCNKRKSTVDSTRNGRWSGIPQTCVLKILTEDHGMKCVTANFVTRVLTQQEFRAEVAQDTIDTANINHHFLKKVITGGTLYGYNRKRKAQSSHWVTKSGGRSRSHMNAMWMLLFDCNVLPITSFLLPGRQLIRKTVSHYYGK